MVAWLTAKTVAIFLGLSATAFCIATIVLAVEKANLESDLEDALNKIDALSAATTTTTTTTTPTTTTAPTPTPSLPTDNTDTTDGGITTPSDDTTSTLPGPTPSSTTPSPTPTNPNPIFPTLPTGLPKPEEIEWRLPSQLQPIRYRLYLNPNLETGACDGTVSIQFQAEEITNLIVLHAKDMNVHSISILNMMARMRIAVDKYYMDDKREVLIIELRELLSISKAYTLSVSFDCNLDNLIGAYRSTYTNENGNKR